MTTEQTSGSVPTWTLGDRLRKARALTGMTTREFADRIGVSHGTITSAENDRRAVRPITLNAWALVTGVDREWLEVGAVRHQGLEPRTRWITTSPWSPLAVAAEAA
jgi:transcriptional regulator with XRE-family HTH domain